MKAKLLQFSEQVSKEKYISPSDIEELMQLIKFPDVVSVELMSSLDKAISWDDGNIIIQLIYNWNLIHSYGL